MDVVTGAYGYTGRHIASRLIAMGRDVVTLTNHPPDPSVADARIRSLPLTMDAPDALIEAFSGADTLYNTYWIRFARGNTTFEKAIEISRMLIDCAAKAGVRRIVHISVTNPSADSPLPYYRGKALVEQALQESGVSHAVLRPNVIFGDRGILLNNIAWFLRHLPIFAVPGDGRYKMSPIYVEDLADVAVKCGMGNDNVVIDAVGPETTEFNSLLQTIREAVDSRSLIVHVPPLFAVMGTVGLGILVRDVVLTPDEVSGLTSNLLCSQSTPVASTPVTGWVRENAGWLGKHYISELRAHYS